MFRKSRWIAGFATVAILVAVTGSTAFAIFPQLQTTLSGPAIDDQAPEGNAKVDQSGLPTVLGQLDVRVKNVNLPNGTPLNVILAGVSVGTITLSFGEGTLSAVLPFQVGRLDLILVTHGATIVLSGGRPWKI